MVESLATGPIPMPVPGVTVMESDNDNSMCLVSTLTLTGTAADLEPLNGEVLACTNGTTSGVNDTITIEIPSEPTTHTQIGDLFRVFRRFPSNAQDIIALKFRFGFSRLLGIIENLAH